MKDQRTKILDILIKPIGDVDIPDALVVFDRILRTIKGSTSTMQETVCSSLCRQFKVLYPDADWQYEHLCWIKHNHFHKLLTDCCNEALKELKNIRTKTIENYDNITD